jgi:oxidase EvaA
LERKTVVVATMDFKNYQSEFESFKACISPFNQSLVYGHSLEAIFESITDWSQFYSLEQIKEWFSAKRYNPSMIVEKVDLAALKDWVTCSKTGNITHKSGDFFSVHGVKVRAKGRENARGWDQPIVSQVGFDGGILGIIRKRFNHVPHYLCEAKEEPGNYGIVQISPSVQATFSNIRQSHGGRLPYFVDFVLDCLNASSSKQPKKSSVLFDSWLAEDGGRLFNKRNRGVLVEVDDSYEITLPNDNFRWLSLYQIKALQCEDAWINPHVRGILAHI